MQPQPKPPGRPRIDSKYTFSTSRASAVSSARASVFAKSTSSTSSTSSTASGNSTTPGGPPESPASGGTAPSMAGLSALVGTQRGSRRFLQRVQSNIRNRSHSLSLRHNMADVTRHGAQLQFAAEQVAIKFLMSLRNYSAFGPVLAAHGVYATPEGQMAGSNNSAQQQQQQQDPMSSSQMGAAFAEVSRDERYNLALAAIEALLSVPSSRLDAATASAMRVQDDFMRRDRSGPDGGGSNPVSPLDAPLVAVHHPSPPPLASFRAVDARPAAKQPSADIVTEFGERTLLQMFSEMAHTDRAFGVWLREHPSATVDEKRGEDIRRNNDRLVAEKAGRARYLRQWQEELQKELYADEAATEVVEQRRLTLHHDAVLEQRRSEALERQKALLHSQEIQRRAWDVFTRSSANEFSNHNHHSPPARAEDGTTNELSLSGHATSEAIARILPSAVSDSVLSTRPDEQLRAWLEWEWHTHTHLHESAALRIQCAWRCYVSKTVVDTARYQRQERQQHILRAEQESAYAWGVAQQVTLTSAADGSAEGTGQVNATLRSISYFLATMTAKAAHRRVLRRHHRAATLEVQTFAATLIQAGYRGLRARQRVNLIRNPHLLEMRILQTETNASVCIQSVARGMLARWSVKRKVAAASKIQRVFRQHVSRKRLHHLRTGGRAKELTEVEQYAGQVIVRFLRVAVAKKYRRYRANLGLLRRIHAVGRGYLCRTRIHLRFDNRRIAAAILIQALVRMLVEKRRVRRMRQRKLDGEDDKIVEHAANVIQRLVRGFLCRTRYRVARRRKAAAIAIQCAWRCHVSRGRIVSRRQAVAAHGVDGKRRDAATAIQSLYRGYNARAHVVPALRQARAEYYAADVSLITSSGEHTPIGEQSPAGSRVLPPTEPLPPTAEEEATRLKQLAAKKPPAEDEEEFIEDPDGPDGASGSAKAQEEQEAARLKQEAEQAEIARQKKLVDDQAKAEQEAARLKQQADDAEAARLKQEAEDKAKAELEAARLKQEAEDAEAARLKQLAAEKPHVEEEEEFIEDPDGPDGASGSAKVPSQEEPTSEEARQRELKLQKDTVATAVVVRFMRFATATKQVRRRRQQLAERITQGVRRQAAISIQQAYRSHAARQDVRARRASRLARERSLREEEGALMVQNFFRCVVAKRTVTRRCDAVAKDRKAEEQERDRQAAAADEAARQAAEDEEASTKKLSVRQLAQIYETNNVSDGDMRQAALQKKKTAMEDEKEEFIEDPDGPDGASGSAKAQEEQEAARLKQHADDAEAARLKQEAEDKAKAELEAARLKQEAQETEAARLKQQAEDDAKAQQEAARLKQEAGDAEAARLKQLAAEKPHVEEEEEFIEDPDGPDGPSQGNTGKPPMTPSKEPLARQPSDDDDDDVGPNDTSPVTKARINSAERQREESRRRSEVNLLAMREARRAKELSGSQEMSGTHQQ